jgi:hypothetical protein
LTLFQPRLARRARYVLLLLLLSVIAAGRAQAAEKTRLRVDDYQISVQLLPETHKLSAHAEVKVTALEALNVVTLQLNNALRVTKLVDANNKPLTPGVEYTVLAQLRSCQERKHDVRLRLRGHA